jgi:hypothetical protein
MNKIPKQLNGIFATRCSIPHSSFIIHHSEGFMSKRKCLEEYDRIGKIMNAEG